MKYRMIHNNYNVFDLEKSLAFYKNVLGFIEARRMDNPNFTLVFLTDYHGYYQIELTFLKDRKERYDLGDNEIHLAVRVDDFDAAYKLHKEMGIICYENPSMGLYFIEDPDGYWIEILPEK
jgi:lactoylglutathione lyase